MMFSNSLCVLPRLNRAYNLTKYKCAPNKIKAFLRFCKLKAGPATCNICEEQSLPPLQVAETRPAWLWQLQAPSSSRWQMRLVPNGDTWNSLKSTTSPDWNVSHFSNKKRSERYNPKENPEAISLVLLSCRVSSLLLSTLCCVRPAWIEWHPHTDCTPLYVSRGGVRLLQARGAQ